MVKLKTSYDPNLSVEENAKKIGCSVANVRKYIQLNGIDRRFDSKLATWKRVNDYCDKNPETSIVKAAKDLEISPNTFIKYCGAPKPIQIDSTKVSKFDLHKYCNVIKSVGDNDECLHGVLKLYVPKGYVDLDMTYNVGGIWESSGLNHPTWKFDKYPQTKDTIELTCENLFEVFDDNTLDSVIFDLPFWYGNFNGRYLKMVDRFSAFESKEELLATNTQLMLWASVLLRPKGILIVKTQNIKTSGKQLWVSDILNQTAEYLGLQKIDEFIYLNRSKMGVASKINQQHCSRKAHGYYLVYKKKTPKELEENGNNC